MRSLLSAVIAVTLTAVCIAADEEPTIAADLGKVSSFRLARNLLSHRKE